MTTEIRDPKDLMVMLEAGSPIEVRRSGEWRVKGGVLARIRGWLHLDSGRQIKLARDFIERLYDLETQPIRLTSSGVAADQIVDYRELLSVAQLIEEQLAQYKAYPALHHYHLLRRAVVSLRYRLEESNGSLSHTKVDPAHAAELFQWAARWKGKQELCEEIKVTDSDKRILVEAAAYPQFVDLLKDDRELRDSFFLWVLRDGLSVAIFIQYPSIQQKIVESNLNGRISRVGGHLLRIQCCDVGSGIREKIVTLPFEGHEISVLDSSRKVSFQGNYVLSIQEVFDTFKAKDRQIGKLEFLAQGVTNWNAHKLGCWDETTQQYLTIDFSRAAWWKQFPVTEILSLSQATQRYGHALDGVQWNIAACATRSRQTLDPKGSHAFLEVAIPIGNGRYHVYSFGKFALKWATNAWETLVAFTDNHAATIAYPDENIFMVSRQHARRSFAVTPDQGMQIMDSIKEDMLRAHSGNLIYQWEGDNCAKWVQDLLSIYLNPQIVPDLRICMLDSQPSDASRYLFAAIRHLPLSLHSPLLSVLHYPLGAWRGKWIDREGKKIWCSLTTSHFWEQKIVYLPAMIHAYNQSGEIMVPKALPESLVQAHPEFVFEYVKLS